MNNTTRVSAKSQIESFWNLIQNSDEGVQKALYLMLDHKYGVVERKRTHSRTKRIPFLHLKGILTGTGSAQTDKELLGEYLEEKYGI